MMWIELAQADLYRANDYVANFRQCLKPRKDLIRSCGRDPALAMRTEERMDHINAYLDLSLREMGEKLLAICEVAPPST